MICNACDIYVVIWGPLYVKNKKKDLFGHFAVCQGLGTRQSDHMASPGHQVRRVARPCTRRTDHSSSCALGKGTRRIWQRCRVPAVRAHGESGSVAVCLPSGHMANSRRRRQLAVTASARFFSPCAYIYTRRKGLPCARLLAHGKQGLCRPRGYRPRFAVGHRRRSLRRVPTWSPVVCTHFLQHARYIPHA